MQISVQTNVEIRTKPSIFELKKRKSWRIECNFFRVVFLKSLLVIYKTALKWMRSTMTFDWVEEQLGAVRFIIKCEWSIKCTNLWLYAVQNAIRWVLILLTMCEYRWDVVDVILPWCLKQEKKKGKFKSDDNTLMQKYFHFLRYIVLSSNLCQYIKGITRCIYFNGTLLKYIFFAMITIFNGKV